MENGRREKGRKGGREVKENGGRERAKKGGWGVGGDGK